MGSNLSGGKHKFKRWEYKRVGVLGFGSWGIYRGSNVDGWMAKGLACAAPAFSAAVASVELTFPFTPFTLHRWPSY